MASTTTRRVTQLRCAPYRASLTYRWAGSWGRRLSLWMIEVFAWGDRCLEDSLAYRATLYAAGRLKRVFSGSLFVKWLWPYVRMAVVPYGEKVTVETALGLVLALACVGPTEIIMLASAGVLVLMLWERCRAAGSGVRAAREAVGGLEVQSGDGAEFQSEDQPADVPEVGSRGPSDPPSKEIGSIWVFPEFGTLASAGAFLIFVVGATISSAVPSLSIFNMAIWLLYFLMFLLAVDASFRGRSVQVIWPFLTGAAFSGLVSVYQRLTGGIVMPSHWIDKTFEGDLVRVVGTFTNPIFFGEMMGLALPLTLTLFFLKRDWRNRLVLLGFAGLQAIGLLLSSTRGAWLGFAVSFCVLAVLYDWRMLPLGAVAGALGLFVAPPVLIQRLVSSFSLADSSNAYRISIWRGSLAIIREHLFRGIGLGAEVFRRVYPEYQIIQTPTPHAHSTFLELLIEVGLPGFAAMACLFWLWLRDAFDAVLSQKGTVGSRWVKMGVLAGCIAAVVGHMVQGVIDYTWYSPRIASVFWAIMGMGAGIASADLRGAKPVLSSAGVFDSEEKKVTGESELS
jgi:putative inorganic carbon (HCO3(-)) transporter